MKSAKLKCVSALAVFALLAIPVGLAAQKRQDHHHPYHHYQLIDMGTFGGPNSAFFVLNGIGRPLNNHGVVAGWAETSASDPFPNYCFNSDCYVSRTFRWQNGVRTDLGSLLGSGSSDAVYISDSGLIVSDAENGQTDPLVTGFPEQHAALWQNGNTTDLGTLPGGGYNSYPSGVNNRGQVVGIATNTVPDPNPMPITGYSYPYQSRAFFWENGVMQDLGTLGNGTDAQAVFINERGQVAGYSYTSSAPGGCGINDLGSGFALTTSTFIWDKKLGMRDIGGLGGTCTGAFGFNNLGQIVGESNTTGDQAFHPFVWDSASGVTELGRLGGNYGDALSINDRGQAVGGSTRKGDVQFGAILWQKKAGKWRKTDLGYTAGAIFAFATSINTSGQVIGNLGYDQAPGAFLWEHGGPMVDLNTLVPPGSGLTISEASTINDRGEIAVNSHDVSGNGHALLLIPCDDNHPGVGGCDYSLADAATAAQAGSTRVPTVQTAAGDGNSHMGLRGQFRGRLAHRFPGFGVQPQKQP